MDQQAFTVNTETPPTDKQPPYNYQVEQALLGAILLANGVYDRVAGIVTAEHFFDPTHAYLFEQMGRMIGEGRVADHLTVAAEGSDMAMYAKKLALHATTTRNAVEYARTIVDLAVRRSLIIISEDLMNAAYDGHTAASPSEMIEDAERQLMKVSEGGTHRTAVRFDSALATVMASANKAHQTGKVELGIPTGLVDLDKMLGGLRKQNLIIIGGRPSMGKTALAFQIAMHHAKRIAAEKRKSTVGAFSAEMSEDELALRILSMEAEVSSDDILRGCDGDVDKMMHVNRVAEKIKSIPLVIDPTGGISITKVAARARQMKRQGGLDALVVDYLQLLTGGSKKDGNRVQEITEITVGLKAIAKELDIPVIALSQLSRKVEDRADKRPQLADLRESGSIEQDADVVLFVYRDEYYVEREKPSDLTKLSEWQMKLQAVAGLAEVIVAKQRHGKVGIVEMAWEGEFARFANLARNA